MNPQLQTVLDALEKIKRQVIHANVAPHGCINEAITIIKEMMAQEPVAWVHKEYRHMQGNSEMLTKEQADGYTNHPDWQALYAAPVAMPAQTRTQIFTTGHCKEKAKPGGCQLHNLQCSYPECDRVLSAAPKGAV